MRVGKDFFNELREEVQNATSIDRCEKKHISLNDILKSINSHADANLDILLKQIDWFSVELEDLIPREKVRAFARGISDVETRLQVLKFLRKYEDYYFKDIIGVVDTKEHEDYMGHQYSEDVYGIIYSIADFHKELNVLVEQIESTGEFSTGKIDQLNAELTNLKQYTKKIEGDLEKQKNEIITLRNELTKQKVEIPCNGLPNLDAICEYAKSLSRDEVKTIQNMLFTLMDITDKRIKDKITAMRPNTPAINVAMGDNVGTKIVKQ